MFNQTGDIMVEINAALLDICSMDKDFPGKLRDAYYHCDNDEVLHGWESCDVIAFCPIPRRYGKFLEIFCFLAIFRKAGVKEVFFNGGSRPRQTALESF